MLLGVDGVGEQPVEGGVVGIRVGADQAIECLTADADVQPVHVRTRGQVRRRAHVVLVGRDDRREVRPVLLGSSEKNVAPMAVTTSESGNASVMARTTAS